MPQVEKKSQLKEQQKEPDLYTVVFINDDFTPVDFVSAIMTRVLGLSESVASQIVSSIHTSGEGTAGEFTRDVAETKSDTINSIATSEQFPLTTTIRPVGA